MKKVFSFLAIAAILCSSMAYGTWPMFQRNAKHDGSGPAGPETNNVSWSLNLGTTCGLFSSPISDSFNGDERIFLGTQKGVYEISSQGGLIQKIDTGYGTEVSVAVHDSTIFFCSKDSLIKKNLTDSTKNWSYYLGANPSAPTIFGGNIYVYANNKLWCFVDTGLSWVTVTLDKGNDKSVSPAVDDSGNIYVATLSNPAAYYDFLLYVYNPNGTMKWGYTALTGEPTGVHGTPTIGPHGEVLVWTYPTQSWPSSLYCINESGRLWQKSSPKIRYSSVGIFGDTIIYCGDNGITACLLSDGSTVWNYALAGPITISSPAIGADGTIYVGNDAGKVLAVSKNGTLLWEYDTKQGPLGSPSIGPNKTLRINSLSGILYVFKQAVGVAEKEKIEKMVTVSPTVSATNFEIQAPERAIKKVYDIAGKLVKTIGSSSWDGTNELNKKLSNGMYFINVSVGGATVTKKIILMR
ncbi:MAG: PQQ-binding-like beta-propeller repeat protein [Patescibacteria group bacterium]|nr:PQQ-binding-like beta-propeller repeat protein [Patescibacteria group bacterium]MDD5534938.1 PQQ-binding-like beta-propeller repeat protein [Patescibacteria group bacterium]